MEKGALSLAAGLGSAASWGAGDFVGGLAARRMAALRVTLAVQAVGLALMATLALALREPWPAARPLAWALAAGISGAIGLTSLYAAFATGRMGIAAPVTAVIGAIVPVAVGSAMEGPPGALRWLGFALALGGIALASGTGGGASRASLGYALLSGLGFGGFYVLLGQVGEGAFLWPLVVARGGSMLAVGALLLLGRGRGGGRAPWWMLVLAGALDTGGNALYLAAAQAGRLDVAAVLSSLYPAGTAILARIVLEERLSWGQLGGVGLMLGAVALIAW